MTILASTSDIIRVVTGSAVSTIEVQASYTDSSGSTYTPGSTETEITTATTTTVVAAPGASTYRKIKTLTIRNNSTSSCVVTVQHYNGTIAADLIKVTLLAGETLIKLDTGRWRHLSAIGAPYTWSAPQNGRLSISGAKAETVSRIMCTETDSAALTSGQLNLQGIYLAAGTVINSISLFTSTTAIGTPTNQIFGLYDARGSLVAQTSNDTTTAWAANTLKTLNLTSAYTVPKSGLYYIGILLTATSMPTFKSLLATGATSSLSANPANAAYMRATGSGGLTALPTTALFTGGYASIIWACVS